MINKYNLHEKFNALRENIQRVNVFLATSDIAFWVIFSILSFLLILPIWQLHYLPFSDLPQHAAQIKMLLNIDDYQQYEADYFRPYILSYLFVMMFGAFLSITLAIKVVLVLALLGIPLATLGLINALKGNRFWVIGSFLTAYNFAFYWGFLSFTVATPIVISLVWFAVEYSKTTITLKKTIYAGLLSLLVFVAHALAWVVAASVVFFVLWRDNKLLSAIQKYIFFLLPLPVVFFWLYFGTSTEGEVGGAENIILMFQEIIRNFERLLSQDKHWLRLKELLSLVIGRESTSIYAFLGMLTLTFPMMLGAKLACSWKNSFPVFVIVLLFMFIPGFFFKTGYIYHRFAVFLLPFSLFLFTRPSPPVNKNPSIVGLFIVLMVTILLLQQNITLFNSAQAQDREFNDFLTQIEPFSSQDNIQYLNYIPNIYIRVAPSRWWHYGLWLQAKKGGTVHQSFTYLPNTIMPVNYIGESPPIWFNNDGPSFNWEKHSGEKYNYFLLHAYNLPEQFKKHMNTLSIVSKSKEWILLKTK